MSTFNLEHPSLLRVPDALRALSSSTSISSSSSYGFDQRSKTSQSSQSTDQTLITPLGSVDSIFGNHPQVEPVPSRFPDLVPWDGLTDEQWKLHSLVSKAECAIKEADIGVFKDLDETFFRDDIWYNDDLYDPDEEFDAVVAVRARLVKGEQTVTTRRALDIIDTRSGLAPTLIADKNSAYDGHSTTRKDVVEEIEDYAEDFEVGDDEVLEVPPNKGSTQGLRRDSVLEAIHEGREQDSLFNETFPTPPLYTTNFLPSTPLIRPVDVVLDCPTSDTGVSTPKYISQLFMSPLVLDNPAIFHNSLGNVNPIYCSPIVSISPFLFSSRSPLPADVTPRARQEIGLGLGLVGVPTSMTQDAGTEGQGSSCAVPFVTESPQHESRKSHIVGGNSYDESVLSFGPALSPLDKMLEGLGQRVTPYVPTTLGSTIPFAGPTSNVVYVAMNTVTAGCSHPAASTSFITRTIKASKVQKGMKGLGLGLPMGLKRRLSRCSSGIPTSEACQDLASLAAAVAPVTLADNRPRRYRGPMLSPIPEVDDSPQPDPYPIPETTPMPSPTRQRNFFKRALKFLF